MIEFSNQFDPIRKVLGNNMSIISVRSTQSNFPTRYQSLRTVHLFVFALILISSSCVGQDDFRFWETSNGTRSAVRLKFLKVADGKVTLQREDDSKSVVMEVEKLSAKDQEYLSQINSAKGLPTKKQAKTSAVDSVSWSQWRGDRRDGKSSETGLLDKWPEGGPPVVWNITGLGEGYSTPSAVDGKIFVMGTDGNDEKLVCLNLSDGATVWTVPMGSKAGGGGFPGPRCTPTVDGERVFAIGSDGTLACVNKQSGKSVWRHNLRAEFAGRIGSWDYSESPLIDGEKLICTPGGTQATVVAFNKQNGAPMWRSSAAELGDAYCEATYASPIVAEISGTRQYLVFLRGGVVGFDAKSGRGLWHYDAPANGTANCSTPVVRQDSLFAASAYGTGGGKAKVTGKGTNWNVQEEYFVKRFENHHGGFVLIDDAIYGTNNSVLMCLDWKSGDVIWQDRSVGKGSVSFADGHLYVRGEGGEIALVAATTSGYQEKGRFMQPDRSDKNAWPHPVIIEGKLLIRDQDRLICFNLK